jgi:acyl-CoA thioester hydrolase
MTSRPDANVELELKSRSTFTTWTRTSVRYNDLDPLGHVNNTAMAIYLEEARCELIAPRLKKHGRHLDIVLASTSMDYLEEMHYPGSVEVGTIATRIGTKSATLAHGIFQGSRCAGIANLVIVFFDLDRRVSIEPPADVRAYLRDLMPRTAQ